MIENDDNPILRVNGIDIFDTKEIANSMNQFCCTVGEKLSNDILETKISV